MTTSEVPGPVTPPLSSPKTPTHPRTGDDHRLVALEMPTHSQTEDSDPPSARKIPTHPPTNSNSTTRHNSPPTALAPKVNSQDNSDSQPQRNDSPPVHPIIYSLRARRPPSFEPGDIDWMFEQQDSRTWDEDHNVKSQPTYRDDTEDFDMPYDSDEQSSDDYKEGYEAKKSTKEWLRRLYKPTSPTTSEEERVDDAEFESIPLTNKDHSSPPRSSVNDADDGRGDDDEAFSDGGHWQQTKSGPIDDATQAEAFALKQEYESRMIALAKQKGVSTHSLFRLVGDETVKHRAVSAWNAFQKYHAAHDGRPDGGEIKFE